MTISPLGGCSLNQTNNSAKVPRLVSSNNLDISRETDAFLSAPRASASCEIVFTSRKGDS